MYNSICIQSGIHYFVERKFETQSPLSVNPVATNDKSVNLKFLHIQSGTRNRNFLKKIRKIKKKSDLEEQELETEHNQIDYFFSKALFIIYPTSLLSLRYLKLLEVIIISLIEEFF